MPEFIYKAKKGPGEIINATIEAETQELAIDKILKLGQTPLDIHVKTNAYQPPVVQKSVAVSKGVQVSRKILVAFIRQLADLTDANVSILRSLEIIRQQKGLVVLRPTLTDMIALIREGKSLSVAMSQFSRIFNDITINMVKAGESSGSLSQVLLRLADVMEKDDQINQKLSAAMTYPLMVMGVGVLTLMALLIFVLPKLTDLFDDLDVALPVATQVIIWLSHTVSQWWWALVILGIVVQQSWAQWQRTSDGKSWRDDVLLKIPIIGAWILKVELARWTRMMSTLIASGMTVVAAMDASVLVCNNVHVRAKLKDVALSVRSGRALKQSMINVGVLDEMTVSLLSIGEESGDMAKSFAKIASIYERDTTHQATVVADIAGPLVLIVIVSIVGVMIVSMMMPIFQMNMMVN